uniref:Putative tick transposon n=1 Tax=Rhipicephalus microplus TaxID=6941 RepID=A0A6G5A9J3_RHIMP
MGKLFERVIHNRLQNFIEDNSLFPATMLGSRNGLSTQDAFLLLQEEVLSYIPTGGEHLILALDLKGAFDTTSHEAILTELNNMGRGTNTYNYIKAFLTERRASISIAQVTSYAFEMPNKGTPQGAILSPLLFNITMLGLTRALDEVPQLGYTLYADDITLWAMRGSLANKEQTLQEAATAVENFAKASGLSCA